jgi:hypothetical protein
MTDINFFNFNDAGEQRSVEIIPENTICAVQLNVKPGGVGADGFLTQAQDGRSTHLACSFVVLEGEYAKRQIWTRLTVDVTAGHAEAKEISRKMLRAMLESARAIRPDDKSDAANAARQAKGWGEFDGLRFMVRLGVRPPQNGYAAQNIIKEVITPDRNEWRRIEQVDRAPTSPPAGVITRPDWSR